MPSNPKVTASFPLVIYCTQILLISITLVVGLQYLTITCLSYGVNFVGMPFHASTSLLNAFCVIYVQGTTHFGMQNLASNTLDLYAFSNLVWVGCSTSHQSTTGFRTNLFIFFSATTSLGVQKKRPIVAQSNTEVEYQCMASTETELTCYLSFLVILAFHNLPFLMKKMGRGQSMWQSYLRVIIIAPYSLGSGALLTVNHSFPTPRGTLVNLELLREVT